MCRRSQQLHTSVTAHASASNVVFVLPHLPLREQVEPRQLYTSSPTSDRAARQGLGGIQVGHSVCGFECSRTWTNSLKLLAENADVALQPEVQLLPKGLETLASEI